MVDLTKAGYFQEFKVSDENVKVLLAIPRTLPPKSAKRKEFNSVRSLVAAPHLLELAQRLWVEFQNKHPEFQDFCIPEDTHDRVPYLVVRGNKIERACAQHNHSLHKDLYHSPNLKPGDVFTVLVDVTAISKRTGLVIAFPENSDYGIPDFDIKITGKMPPTHKRPQQRDSIEFWQAYATGYVLSPFLLHQSIPAVEPGGQTLQFMVVKSEHKSKGLLIEEHRNWYKCDKLGQAVMVPASQKTRKRKTRGGGGDDKNIKTEAKGTTKKKKQKQKGTNSKKKTKASL
jgi:hypothetical protein